MLRKIEVSPWLPVLVKTLGILALLSNSTHAQEGTGAYLGANFARELNSYNSGYLDTQYQDEASKSDDSLGITNRSVHRFNWVWWADAGYFFSPYIALEASYFHLGEFRYKSAGFFNLAGAEEPTNTSVEITSRGPALSLLGRLPLTEAFELDLRLGDYVGKTNLYNRIDIAAQGVVVTGSKTTSSLLASVGAAYTFAGHYSMDFDYVRVNKTGDSSISGKFSVNLLSAGVRYIF